MLIDFNPSICNVVKPQIVRPCFFAQESTGRDVFIKSTKMDPLYEGIKIDKKSFGKIKKTGETAQLYTITNKNGASVDLSSFGATIVGIKVKDKKGQLIDVVQGYDSVTPYEEAPIGHAGGTIGPCANKIAGGKFKIGEKEYTLECNKDGGKSHSHGGSEGFDVQNWHAKVLKDGVEFTLLKEDMQNGYPGNVVATVIYKFDNDNNLHVNYKAISDKDTLINMTNHSYFNLDGVKNTGENSIYNHVVKLPNSSKFAENDGMGIPTGRLVEVAGTPFDFREVKRIGDVIDSNHEQIKNSKGFDQNYCIDTYDGKSMIEVAEVKSDASGIKMKVSTNLPGFQFYTANNLGKPTQPLGKDGLRYEKRSGLCVEPQFYPNAINTEQFEENGILKAGDEYSRAIIYSFSVE